MFKLLGQAQEKLPISENLFKCENATFIDIHSSVNFMTKEVTFKGKVQFDSRDGRYNCVDMDIARTEKEAGIRPVNINTIKWLIFDGIKYIVE